MCFYMSEALPTQNTGLIFDGDEDLDRAPPVHNVRTSSCAISRPTFSGEQGIALGAPTFSFCWHEVGTARFGKDPGTSVLDPNCQVHGIKGLYVVDASTLPSAGAVNTALTIIALALRAGDHISRRRS